MLPTLRQLSLQVFQALAVYLPKYIAPLLFAERSCINQVAI